MAKNEQNIRASEEFIRNVLEKKFGQRVEADALRNAAERLCDAVPENRRAAA